MFNHSCFVYNSLIERQKGLGDKYMKILGFPIGKQSVELKPANNNRLSAFQPQLKMLNADTISFTGATKAQDKFLNPAQISQLTEAFTQGLTDLKESGNLSFDSAKALIGKLLPAKNVEILPIEVLAQDIPELGDPKAQAIFGVFNPVIDETGEMKFKIYYDFSNSETANQKDVKQIAQVHEFIHLLQASTEHNYKMTKNALKTPPMVVDSYQQMNGIFHAMEYKLYTSNGMPKEQYVHFVKDHVDSYFSRGDTPAVLKFTIMSAFNEAQAHCESLKSLQNVLKLQDLAPDSPYKMVHGTVPIYMNFAEAALTVIKDRDNILKDHDREVVNFYETQLNKLKEDYSNLKI